MKRIRAAFAAVFSHASAAVLAAFFVAAPATAANLCLDRDELVELIEAERGAALVARGLKVDGLMMEIFAAPEGYWTTVWTWPTGQSCIIDMGTGYSPAAPAKGGGI